MSRMLAYYHCRPSDNLQADYCIELRSVSSRPAGPSLNVVSLMVHSKASKVSLVLVAVGEAGGVVELPRVSPMRGHEADAVKVMTAWLACRNSFWNNMASTGIGRGPKFPTTASTASST